MKEYFYEKDNKAYIIDDAEGIIVQDAKDNIEETLIVQNNIEEIELEIKESKENKKNMEILAKSEKKRNIIASIFSAFGIFVTLHFAFEIMPVFSSFVCAAYVLVLTVGFKEYKNHKKQIKLFETYSKELEIELENENEKLKVLKLDAKDKIVESTIIKEVPKSDIKENLNIKKELIIEYFNNRKKYLSAFKENNLNNLLQSNNYSQSDIEFIKCLIEEDLKNENINSKKKEKQKNKTKTL